jgi:uncharacterized protein YraI
VTADVLNIRTGPGLEYEVAGLLRRGAALDIRARTENGDWAKVSTATGLVGWVALEYVDLNIPLGNIPLAVEGPSTPVGSPTMPATAQVPATATATPHASPIATTTPVSSSEG